MAGIGFSIYSGTLSDLETLRANAPIGVDVSAPTPSVPPSDLAFDLNAVTDLGHYAYKALVFINTVGGTLKVADWIWEWVKKAGSDKNAASPIFVIEVNQKAYSIRSPADLEAANAAIAAGRTET